MNRICSRCNKFPVRGDKRYDCNKCAAEKARDYTRKFPDRLKKNRRNRAEKRREIIYAAKNKPCKDCGIKYPAYVMDFDHLGDKSFTISHRAHAFTIETVVKEIAKCDVVCANCHRIRTFLRFKQKNIN